MENYEPGGWRSWAPGARGRPGPFGRQPSVLAPLPRSAGSSPTGGSGGLPGWGPQDVSPLLGKILGCPGGPPGSPVGPWAAGRGRGPFPSSEEAPGPGTEFLAGSGAGPGGPRSTGTRTTTAPPSSRPKGSLRHSLLRRLAVLVDALADAAGKCRQARRRVPRAAPGRGRASAKRWSFALSCSAPAARLSSEWVAIRINLQALQGMPVDVLRHAEVDTEKPPLDRGG